MDFLALAKERYSCRSFSSKKVEKEMLDKILEAGRLAPTGRNNQPQRVFVIQDEEELKKIGECTDYGWGAPVMLVVCYDKTISWKRKYDGIDGGVFDASIVATHMMLEIENLGLGTTWIGSFQPNKLRELYNISDDYEIVALLPVGYKADDSKPSELHQRRNPIEEMVFWL